MLMLLSLATNEHVLLPNFALVTHRSEKLVFTENALTPSLHILVFDHSAVTLANFQHSLMEAGFRVTGRFPREINLREVQKHSPDAIVLGLVETFSTATVDRMVDIHDEPTTSHIPIIVASPRHHNIILRLPEVGMTHVHYTPEPFEIDAVIAQLRALT